MNLREAHKKTTIQVSINLTLNRHRHHHLHQAAFGNTAKLKSRRGWENGKLKSGEANRSQSPAKVHLIDKNPERRV